MVNRRSLKSRDELKTERERSPWTLWTSTLKTEEAKKEFLQLMSISNGPVLKRLLEIVVEEKNKTNKNSLSLNNYDSPSWAYIQADNVGYQRGLNLIEHLLKDIVK